MGKAFRAAFPYTVPVMLGYLSLGIAYGLVMDAAGFDFVWTFFASVFVYAGSAQFMGVDFLATMAPLAQVFLMTFIINFRHMVYGLSMIEKYRDMGRRKPYMIFALPDETYAILASAEPPEGVSSRDFYFAVSLLDHIYWVAGSVIGGLLGAALPINTTGADFAMTALFVVIAVGQWEEAGKEGSHLPALIGACAAVGSLLLFGQSAFLPPALGIIVLALVLLRGRLDREGAAA